ncbi:hypothetical protein SCHPADRAFT_998804 [Schizopora paradoxa]|uniref:Sodium/calcium exchanger membrane region domain-containing protein n=1 Tax=Schizopora paradoxa TaxID=27342 RepID=A0A0H2RHX8_9AGAM|nr:hypothetical protein SCHPADRAFT_998804 [Schizopora paradoxa]
MLPGLPRAAFASFIIVQAIVWSHSRYGSHPRSASSLVLQRAGHLAKRSSELPLLGVNGDSEEDECAPLSYPTEEQCAHVQESCPRSETFLNIPYIQQYFCTPPQTQPFVFAGLIVWLIFLFSTLGISASDFFCPNLASIADMLGLDESVAGVTFLAFGNGSPDVFSTFSAMRADSGSLAVGELLGAASFIVSVVVGSLCIIKPFNVDKKPFLRDVGFFTVAVALLIGILWDGEIHAWEAATLIALYFLYVCVVTIGTWWDKRQLRKKELAAIVRGEYADEEIPEPQLLEPYRDDPQPRQSLELPSPSPRIRAHSSPAVPSHLGVDVHDLPPPRERGSRTPSPSPRLSAMPSFSLVGALEFRQVVTSLQHQSSGSSLDVFESPVTPFAGGHYHTRHTAPRIPNRRRISNRSLGSMHDPEANLEDPWDAALGQGMQLSQTRSPAQPPAPLPGNGAAGDTTGANMSAPAVFVQPDDESLHTPGVPRIATTPASPTSEMSLDDEHRPYVPPTRRQRVLHAIRHTVHVLFPTLHNLRSKSVLGMLASVLAAPAVLALTVTLPVHVTPRHNSATSEKHEHEFVEGDSEDRLLDFEEDGVERVLTAEDEVETEMHELKFNKWLMASQCILGPLFCVAVLCAGAEQVIWLFIAALVTGLSAAGLVIAFANRGNDPAAQMARCFMGFFVAVVWIMAIADEVVNVLKTFGFIFGLSDAIVGLTIFAVGNSLADFVANISVAAFAPAMGFAACFGGPMLNILLGVGVSGSYIIHTTGQPYTMHFSTTLFVSTVGLLSLLTATMIFVPWNGYHLPKAWGVFLVICYVIIMVVNVVTEIHKDKLL